MVLGVEGCHVASSVHGGGGRRLLALVVLRQPRTSLWKMYLFHVAFLDYLHILWITILIKRLVCLHITFTLIFLFFFCPLFTPLTTIVSWIIFVRSSIFFQYCIICTYTLTSQWLDICSWKQLVMRVVQVTADVILCCAVSSASSCLNQVPPPSSLSVPLYFFSFELSVFVLTSPPLTLPVLGVWWPVPPPGTGWVAASSSIPCRSGRPCTVQLCISVVGRYRRGRWAVAAGSLLHVLSLLH